MKKLMITISFFCICGLMFSGCVSEIVPDAGTEVNQSADLATNTEVVSNTNTSANIAQTVVEIKERLFIQQCNDIFNNPEDYENKTIKIEGICDTWEEDGKTLYSVYRNTPGCCGVDGICGFTFEYDGDVKLQQNDWIAVEGTVKIGKNSSGYKTVTLDILNLAVKADRGAEFVNN